MLAGCNAPVKAPSDPVVALKRVRAGQAARARRRPEQADAVARDPGLPAPAD